MSELGELRIVAIDWIDQSPLTLVARRMGDSLAVANFKIVLVGPRILKADINIDPYFPAVKNANITGNELQIEFEEGLLCFGFDSIHISEKT